MTTPPRTLLDLAGVVGQDVLELALEDALRRGLTSIPRLEWRMDELCKKGRPGCKQMARLVADRDRRARPTESGLETKIWRFIKEFQLPRPERQYEVALDNNRAARPDFAYPHEKLALEGHSYRFHSGRAAWERDRQRHAALIAHGWRVIYISKDDLDHRKPELAQQILAALNSRGTAF